MSGRLFILSLLALCLAPDSVGLQAAPSAKPTVKPTAVRKVYPRITTESGLIYQDIVLGKGATPENGKTIVVHYTGRLLGGRQFDSSYAGGAPLAFVLGDGTVIRGWEEGVRTMKVGGRRRLIIPPNLGYRDNIVGSIPPDSTLDFDVVLVEVK